MVRGILGALLGVATALGLFTWWALDSSEIVIVTTTPPSGEARETHVWFVESEGELWLEAGTPENPWFRDLEHDSRLRLREADGPAAWFEARPMPEHSARVRTLLAEKYGVRDRWVQLFVDASESVAVRLLPVRNTGTNAAGLPR